MTIAATKAGEYDRKHDDRHGEEEPAARTRSRGPRLLTQYHSGGGDGLAHGYTSLNLGEPVAR